MKIISVLLLLLISIFFLPSAQSINYNQELCDLILSRKWFDIDRYYELHKDSITNEFVKLFYVAETSKAFNNSDKCIDAYEQLLDKNLLVENAPKLITGIGQNLLQNCANEQEFAKGEMLCYKMIAILQKDTSRYATSLIKDLEASAETFKAWKNNVILPIIIDKDPQGIGVVKLTPGTSDNGIYFNAKWNGIELRTCFDTGCSTCYIFNRTTAEKIGVKFNNADTTMLNNNIKVLSGVIDSLTFGKYTIKNVHVDVNIENIDSSEHRQTLCDSILNSRFDIVLGMTIIKKLGVVEFDFEKNSMSFPKKETTSNQRNIYIEDGGTTKYSYWSGRLYMNMIICEDNFLTFFDTGGQNGLLINTDFYVKNKQHILVNEQASLDKGAIGGCNNESFFARYEYKCPKIDVQINDKIVTMINECTVAKDKENNYKDGTTEGGFLGNGIFRYCKKAVFDFNNMGFSIDPKGTNR